MALAVKTTPMADAQILDLLQLSPPIEYAEVDQVLGIICGHNPPPPLPGNQHGMKLSRDGIAILNHQYDIYFFEPASPGLYILVAYDQGTFLTVAILKDRTTALPWSDSHQARNLTTEAANALGITVSDIHVL
jgi:hypothetical protein